MRSTDPSKPGREGFGKGYVSSKACGWVFQADVRFIFIVEQVHLQPSTVIYRRTVRWKAER